MGVLTVITTKNYHTVHLNEALVNIKRIKLLSCSLYNSWYNLKRKGSISIHESKDVTRILGKFILAIIQSKALEKRLIIYLREAKI